jgi:branched-chain amino acid transport system permease protein
VDVNLFVSQTLNGIGNGVVYASIALALVLIFRTTGLLNFAQGEMALFSTYLAWKFTTTGMPVVLAVVLSMILSFIGGAIIERVLIRPVEVGRSPLNVVIVTLGMFLAINSVVQLIFGTDPQEMPSMFPSGTWKVGDISVQKETMGLITVLLIECLLLYVLLQRTTLGLKIRAVASNQESSRLLGINAGFMLMFGWALSASLGALAGSLVAAQRTGFDASLMQSVLVYAFAAAALGGFDSPLGAVLSGVIVGVADTLTKEYVDPLDGIEILVPLGLILVVLLVRPTGLFGRQTVERV